MEALISGIVICTILLITILSTGLAKSKEKQKKLESDLKKQIRDNEYCVLRISKLEKYQICVDAEYTADEIIKKANKEAESINFSAKYTLNNAESQAKEILSSAEETLNDAEIKAKNTLTNAKIEANTIVSNAREKIKSNLLKSDEALADALKKAKSLVDEAEARAREIAGEAYDMSKDLDFYKEALTAIKNTIDGYGLTYVKPLESVLDGLSEDYGFTEAGRELTQARNATKGMVSQGLAASCDYVERSRRETAIAFVLDAFNGKVDSILSLIKKDNYGVLEQKIKDAYEVVNLLGRPFRNARITPEYLSARLDELRLGTAVIALKLKDKEEQRAIKEQMREEERARREYERAIKEAAKEESTLRKAMEKARTEMEKANEAQKEKYETMLADLTAKLQEAEEKSQRAMSMAQQTRSGHVYIISNVGSFGENIYKIGMTRRLEPSDRVRELGDASVPFPFDIHAMIYSEDAPALETALHKRFMMNQVNKVNPKKEFFKLNISDIKKEVESRNIEVVWTLMAEAAQYRESLALEASFKDSAQKDEWATQQINEMQSSKEIDQDD